MKGKAAFLLFRVNAENQLGSRSSYLTFSSQLLTNFTCLWKQEYSHFPSIIPGSLVLLFCPYFLWSCFQWQSWQFVQIVFDSGVHLFCSGFVLNFPSSVLSWGCGSMPVWAVVSLVARPYLCFQLSSAVLGKLQSAFWKAPSTEVIIFITYCFELTIPNQAVFLSWSINSPRTFAGGHNFCKPY